MLGCPAYTSGTIACTTTYVRTALAVPGSVDWRHLQLMFSAIVTAASATWYVSSDAAGNYPLMDLQSAKAFVAEGTTADAGGLAVTLESLPLKEGDTPYLHVKLNAGTANLVFKARGVVS